MSPISQEQLIHDIHAASRRMVVVVVTGGGSGAISALLSVGGASRTVLAAAVPYSQAALVEWLGGTPDEFCAPRTARAMAMAAYEKARQYDPAAKVCGIACTASLASDRPKRGPHRAHLAAQTESATTTVSLELKKGLRSRGEEEALVAQLILNLIAEIAGIAGRLELNLAAGEVPQIEGVAAPPAQQKLLASRIAAVPIGAAQTEPRPRAVFPGAFNPLHEAHRRMAALAAETLGCTVAYEISIENVDKPWLDFIEIDNRLRQFAPAEAVWLTRAPRFVEKSRLFPGATFVVGADTIERIGLVRYYGGQEHALQEAIAAIAAQGCRFLVFGRKVAGRFCTLADLEIPGSLAGLCQAVPAQGFRHDISSSELRQQQAASDREESPGKAGG